jgi:hypothetical protein
MATMYSTTRPLMRTLKFHKFGIGYAAKYVCEESMRTPGVEPGSQAWEACMIPLHYVRDEFNFFCGIHWILRVMSAFVSTAQ